MKKRKIKLGLILGLICLVLVSLGGCGQAAEIQQELVKVTRGDLMLSVSASGNLSFARERKLTFGTAGTIAKINVEEGERVTKGQVLAILDITSLEQALKAAEIDLKTAEFNLEKARDSYRKMTYPYTYYTFAFSVPEALAAIGDSLRELNEAIKILLELGLSREQYSWQQYWDVWHAVKRAQDKLVDARAKLVRGEGVDVFGDALAITDFWTLRAAQLEMEKAQLAVEKAQLALDKAKDDRKKAEMFAPFGGVIATVNVKEGDNLSSVDYATKVIIELIDPSSMELTVEVDEIDIVNISLNQRAIITVDALPNKKFEGKVIFTSSLPKVAADVVLYKVKIGFNLPQESGLKGGMSATADIIIAKRSNVLLVPSQAIKRDSQGNPLVKVRVGEQIQERSVVTGISDGFQTEIVDGLSEGDVVIEARSKEKPTGGGFFLK